MFVERRQEEDRRPAECDIERDIEPARCAHPCDPDEGEGESADPDEKEEDDRLILIQQEDGKGGVGAGNQEGDIGVIDPAPDQLGLRLPGDPVIEGATGKERDRSQGEDPQGDPTPQFIGQGDQNQARHQGYRAHNQVNQAPELGFGGRGDLFLPLWTALWPYLELLESRKPGHGSRVEVWRPISPFGVSAGRAGAGGSIREAVLTIEAWVSYLSPLLF